MRKVSGPLRIVRGQLDSFAAALGRPAFWPSGAAGGVCPRPRKPLINMTKAGNKHFQATPWVTISILGVMSADRKGFFISPKLGRYEAEKKVLRAGREKLDSDCKYRRRTVGRRTRG